MKKSTFLLPFIVFSLTLAGCSKEEEKPIEQTENGNSEENSEKDNPNPIKNSYTINWNNYDGSLLTSVKVNEGEIPSFEGTPTRNETDDYTYTFSGWNPTVVAATSDATYTATYTEKEKIKPIEISSIAEVRELCKTVTNLNDAKIGVNKAIKVRIQGWAFHKMTLVKTTKKFGYDVSYPNKVFLGDSTGYIACASNSGQGSLYFKVNDYAGNEKSKYDVTGYISMYMGQPEIYIPDGDDEVGYTYNANLSVSCDFNTIATTKTLEEYYNDFTDVFYNCAGHGYKDIVKINNLSIVDVIDADTYIGTDGDRVIKIKKGVCGLAKGKTYNVTGLVQTNNFVPSLNLLSSSSSTEPYTYLKESSAIETTIQDYISTFYKLPFEDTKENMGELIRKFQFSYKIEGYISAYNTNGKLYVTLEPTFNSAKDYPTRENAICIRGAITLRNDNCWNTTEEQIILFAKGVGGYLNENTAVSICVSPILFENMTYNQKKYHEIKNFVFSDLVPEFEEE